MSNITLAVIACLLGLCVALTLTNPTPQEYGAYLQGKLALAVGRMDQALSGQERELLRSLYETQGPKLIELVVRQHTRRRNFGLFCLFESNVLEQKVVVLGIATKFVPIEGVEEATVKLGQLVPTIKR